MITMKKTLLLLFSLVFCLFSKAENIHPYHVGSVEITYNEKSKTFEIVSKLFLDDLEKALKQKYDKPIDFHKKNSEEEINALLSSYFNENLMMKVNNSSLQLNYLGFEIDRESVNIYLESREIPSPKTLEINNTLLYDYAEEQINIVHVIINNVRKSYKLEYPTNNILL